MIPIMAFFVRIRDKIKGRKVCKIHFHDFSARYSKQKNKKARSSR